MALCIQVKDFEFIHIGPDIRISIERVSKHTSRIWIEAPRDLVVLRDKHLKDLDQDDGEPEGTD